MRKYEIKERWSKISPKDKMILELKYELEKTSNELDLLRMQVQEHKKTESLLIGQIKYLSSNNNSCLN